MRHACGGWLQKLVCPGGSFKLPDRGILSGGLGTQISSQVPISADVLGTWNANQIYTSVKSSVIQLCSQVVRSRADLDKISHGTTLFYRTVTHHRFSLWHTEDKNLSYANRHESRRLAGIQIHLKWNICLAICMQGHPHSEPQFSHQQKGTDSWNLEESMEAGEQNSAKPPSEAWAGNMFNKYYVPFYGCKDECSTQTHLPMLSHTVIIALSMFCRDRNSKVWLFGQMERFEI